MMQIEGSKRARVGVLFSVNSDAHLSSLLFVKVFEITASSFRFVLFMKAYNYCYFFMALDANLSPSFIFNVYACFFMVSCSHKKNALDFLDKLCSFYEQNYFFASPTAAENTQAFLDKVYELAEANGLPSKALQICPS
jgi:UDP-glucose:glycoprotein glucosyltransferase